MATSGFLEIKRRRGKNPGGQSSYLHVKRSPRRSPPLPRFPWGRGIIWSPRGGSCDPGRRLWERGGGFPGPGGDQMAAKRVGLRGKGSRPRVPPMGNFMGVVICGTGRLRPRPTPTPPSAPRPEVAGKVAGALLRAPPRRPRRQPPLPPRLSQSRCLLLTAQSSLHPAPRLRPPTAEGGREDGEGGAGGGRQGEWWGRTSQAHSWACGSSLQLGQGAAWSPRPGTRRLASGAPARQPSCPPGRADLEAGAHGPSGGLGGFQLARPGARAGSWGVGGAPGGQILISPLALPPLPRAAETHALTL